MDHTANNTHLLILRQAMVGLGSPDTEQEMSSLEPVSFTSEPWGWSLTWGREWMISWAVTSTWRDLARFCSHWSCSYITALSLVESFILMP